MLTPMHYIVIEIINFLNFSISLKIFSRWIFIFFKKKNKNVLDRKKNFTLEKHEIIIPINKNHPSATELLSKNKNMEKNKLTFSEKF